MKASEKWGKCCELFARTGGRPAPTEEEILAWGMVDELLACRAVDVLDAAKRRRELGEVGHTPRLVR